uniref:Globin family profile domain-containing protein n=1 Tax=Odontella aurita TaxID=265563 RepID=A0A7S4IWL3_9STRA|mmetsp:Transcript_3145/g.8209  ORF Transcript_3145/g.8209 Transcript_3145/m.8209 type:complete len:192 (+) Transcript_3145:226-801(+)
MSKYEIRAKTHTLSGITHAQSLLASTSLSPPLLTRIGGPPGFHLLATLFYKRVFADKSNPWFLGIFASSTQSEAIDNQYRFLVQTFGGEELYKEKKGKFTRLVGRHANYKIGAIAAERWMYHMERAIDEHDALAGNEEGGENNDGDNNAEDAREYLKMYFRFTAFYIVAASEYMRDDQLSGGTQMDSGRIW